MRRNYPYKVWLSTILVSPFILMAALGLYNAASPDTFSTLLPLIILMILFGGALSLPSLFLFSLLFKKLSAGKIRVEWAKLVLAITGVSFVWITFYFFDNDFFEDTKLDQLAWPGIYSLVLLASSFLHKMKAPLSSENRNLR